MEEFKGFPFSHLLHNHAINLDNLQKVAENPLKELRPRKHTAYKYTGQVLVRNFWKTHFVCDALSDFYTEDLRLRVPVSTKGNKTHAQSPLERWQKSTDKEIVGARLERYLHEKSESDRKFLFDYRDKFYPITANSFNPCIMLYLLAKYNMKGKRVLDPTAGWGDRLIAAILFGVGEYVGYDTNPALIPRYEQICVVLDTKVKTRFLCEPFEYSAPDSNFDLVFTSPPFFDVELYEGEHTSTNLYKTRDEWDTGFYLPFLQKSTRSLKVGGYIMLYIPFEMFKFASDFMETVSFRFVEQFGFYSAPDNSENIVNSKIRYTYIWIKDY